MPEESITYVDELIVELLANELPLSEIAKEFGVSRTLVYAINSGSKHRIDDFKYPIRELDCQLDKNSTRQQLKAKSILANMEPEITYSLHIFPFWELHNKPWGHYET